MSAIEQHSTTARLFFELEGTEIKAYCVVIISYPRLRVEAQYINEILYNERYEKTFYEKKYLSFYS